MSVTITLPDGLGERIRVEAAREGLLVDEFVGRELRNRLVQAHAVALSESTLLQKIGEGFPEVFWTRYRFLRGRLNQGEIPESERLEYLEMVDRVEQRNASRLGFISELAMLRGVSLTETIAALGLQPNA